MLKKITGATRVEIFDHTVRRGERPTEITADTPENRKPVTKVHVDQTPQSGRKRVIRHTGEDAERLLRGKAQLINVWRPLRGPVKDMPLAFADARTLKKEDLVPSRLIYKDQPEGETFQVKVSYGTALHLCNNQGANISSLCSIRPTTAGTTSQICSRTKPFSSSAGRTSQRSATSLLTRHLSTTGTTARKA